MNKNKAKYLIYLFILLGCIVLLPPRNSQAAMIALSDEALTARAQTIIIGTVQSTNSYWNEDRTAIMTDIAVKIDESLKGMEAGTIITIQVQGGIVDDIAMRVSDTPVFEEGEEVLLFLNEKDGTPGIQRLAARAQGKYSIQINQATQKKEAISESGVRVNAAGTVYTDQGASVQLDEFITKIKAIIVQQQNE